jgi:hypothetical protein
MALPSLPVSLSRGVLAFEPIGETNAKPGAQFPTGGLDMSRLTRTAILSFLAAASLLLAGTLTATADSGLPDAAKAGFADKLYRLDCGHSLANDESVWTPGANVGRSIEFSSTCWLTAWKRMATLGYRSSPIRVERPQRLVNPS